jgi:hypothetical protein
MKKTIIFSFGDMDLPIFKFILIIGYAQRLGIKFECLELIFAIMHFLYKVTRT